MQASMLRSLSIYQLFIEVSLSLPLPPYFSPSLSVCVLLLVRCW